MLATIASASVVGVDGRPITVEVHVSSGLPSYNVVGLVDAACRESRDRVRAALISSGQEFPMARITVNLAPTGVPKGGPGLDLAIAVGIMVANEAIEADRVAGRAFLGELGLDGSVRPVHGVVAMADAVTSESLVVPTANVAEARLLRRHQVEGVSHLTQVVAALVEGDPWPEVPPPAAPPAPPPAPDLADVRGQPVARRALEIAAAGGHNLLMSGPPGAGKTMLAHRLVGLLPPLADDQALAVTRVHSAAGLALPPGGLVRCPPFRAPHHSSSVVSLVGGGGAVIRPGEVSCATGGVLFLDELGEFPPAVLDQLRQPLEDGVIRISRARSSVVLPARFQLVAATNPCPCGASGAPGACRCTDAARSRYRRRLSGPLLDRFDLRITVVRPDTSSLLRLPPGESSEVVAQRVQAARARVVQRGVPANAAIAPGRLDELVPLDDDGVDLLGRHLEQGRLSARGVARTRRVARTIADLADAERVEVVHLAEALALRSDDTAGRWAA